MECVLYEPNKELIDKYIAYFDNENDDVERSIIKLIKLLPNNDNIDDVLLKTTVINRLYNTNIYDIYKMSYNILSLNIDEKLKNNNISLVNLIASGYSIVKDGINKNIFCYSFATKYCNWHNISYPIYDSIVDNLIYLYNKKYTFSNFKRYDLKNYELFINILNDFIRFFSLESYNYKELDKFFWQYGKEVLKLNQ